MSEGEEAQAAPCQVGAGRAGCWSTSGKGNLAHAIGNERQFELQRAQLEVEAKLEVPALHQAWASTFDRVWISCFEFLTHQRLFLSKFTFYPTFPFLCPLRLWQFAVESSELFLWQHKSTPKA